MSKIYSLQIERHVLGGLIKHPEIFPEIDGFVTEKDFFNDVHYTIYNVIKSCAYQNQSIDSLRQNQKIVCLLQEEIYTRLEPSKAPIFYLYISSL